MGGKWEVCTGHNAGRELSTVETLSRSGGDFALLKREIKTKMELAAAGDLTYGKDEDVYACASATLVLELRFDQRTQYPDGQRAVRLYFSEPAHQDGVLLSALFGAKPASRSGLKRQNDHIEQAQFRIEGHFSL